MNYKVLEQDKSIKFKRKHKTDKQLIIVLTRNILKLSKILINLIFQNEVINVLNVEELELEIIG